MSVALQFSGQYEGKE